MRRRDFLQVLSVLPATAFLTNTGRLARVAAAAPAPAPAASSPVTPFSAADVHEFARALSAKKFLRPERDLPKTLQELTYDQYRDIRFKPERAIWAAEELPFRLDLFHRGFFFKDPVTIYIVADGQAQRIAYSPDMFTFGPLVPPLPDKPIMNFAGFRLRARINRADYFDEFAVFLGASYFRAVAKGQLYGLSARGLALNTGGGEEFPFFRSFWIERPRRESSTIVAHALLDSESTAGAYRFTLRPGEPTVMDVEMTLYPRVELQRAGLAPLTSMFLFAPNDRLGIDDFRPSAHDSDGLAIWNGKGEWLWRPLINPDMLQVSAFVDNNPRGFGLLQRQRTFEAYQDLESRFERRPSLWVEAIGDWGTGTVELVEIPSKSEFNDNIVAFWRPSQPLPAQAEYRFTYRLHWCWTPPAVPALAMTLATRVGAGTEEGTRLFVVDFVGGRLGTLPQDAALEPVFATSAGTIKNPVTHPNPETKGWRVSFVLTPNDAELCDLRCTLKLGEEFLSEVWSYRWTR